MVCLLGDSRGVYSNWQGGTGERWFLRQGVRQPRIKSPRVKPTHGAPGAELFLNGSMRGTQLRNCSTGAAARAFAELFLRGGPEAASQNNQADKPGDCPHESAGHIYRKHCSGSQRHVTDHNQRADTRKRAKYHPICPEGRPIRD